MFAICCSNALFRKKDTTPVQLETGRFPMSSISTKDSIKPSPRSVLCSQQQKTLKIAYHAMGQGGARTSPVFLTNELAEGNPGAQGNGFQGRGAIWDETKFRKLVFNTHRRVTFSAETCRVNFPSVFEIASCVFLSGLSDKYLLKLSCLLVEKRAFCYE